MNKTVRKLRVFNTVWLGLTCLVTLPWAGFVYAAPVVAAYFICRSSQTVKTQLVIAVGNVSLVYLLYSLWRFIRWKLSGNYDAQEALFYVFLLVEQWGISLLSMLITMGTCIAIRNLRTPYV